MKFFASLSVLASIASAASVDVSKRSAPLEVKLEKSGNSGIHAALTNTGSESVKLFKTGTILDSNAVEKVQVFSGKSRLAFDGIRLTVSTSDLSEDAFQVIKAGETVEVDFDAAELHDLSEGGAFDMLTSGSFSYAELDSTKIAGAMPFKSNTLSGQVDGVQAAATRHSFQEKVKRTNVQSDCTGPELEATVNAIGGCRDLAAAAREAATSDSARLQEFFKSTSASTADTVEGVFGRIEDECGSTDSGVSDYYCTDQLGACAPGVIAYALPSQSFMVNCPTFFNQMPASSSQCYGQAQDNTILHEMTHLNEIAGTDDYGGYGYDFVQSLSPAQNLNHADTYTLFAQSLAAGC